MVDFAGIVVGLIFGIFVSIFGLFGFRFLKWYRHRNDVFLDLDLRRGKTLRFEMKPREDGTVTLGKYGRYYTRSEAMTLYKGRPLYRFRQGDMRPIRFTPAKVQPAGAANGGSPELQAKLGMYVELANAEHATVPPESAEVFFKQHLFADAFASRLGLLVLLGIGILVILFAVIGLYARG